MGRKQRICSSSAGDSVESSRLEGILASAGEISAGNSVTIAKLEDIVSIYSSEGGNTEATSKIEGTIASARELGPGLSFFQLASEGMATLSDSCPTRWFLRRMWVLRLALLL